MDRWQSNTNDPEELFTMTYRAGLRELFEPCHDPLPGRMAGLKRTTEQLDQRQNDLTFSGGALSALWRDDSWP